MLVEGEVARGAVAAEFVAEPAGLAVVRGEAGAVGVGAGVLVGPRVLVGLHGASGWEGGFGGGVGSALCAVGGLDGGLVVKVGGAGVAVAACQAAVLAEDAAPGALAGAAWADAGGVVGEELEGLASGFGVAGGAGAGLGGAEWRGGGGRAALAFETVALLCGGRGELSVARPAVA